MELSDYEEGFDELGRTMRKQGKSVNEAAKYFEGKSVSEKNEYLFQNGINFNEVPPWQKRGIGL